MESFNSDAIMVKISPLRSEYFKKHLSNIEANPAAFARLCPLILDPHEVSHYFHFQVTDSSELIVILLILVKRILTYQYCIDNHTGDIMVGY